MFNPLKQLNHFFKLATERKLSGSDQLMYLHIFNKFNAAHWTETLRIKDAELKDLMRLYDTNGKPSSIDVIRRGRQRLKSKGFIDFTSGTGYEPEYRMTCLYPADTPADTPADSSANPYIRVREDVKDVKTKSSSSARAREKIDEAQEHWEHIKGGRLTFEHLSELQVLIDKHGLDWLKNRMTEASDANGNSHGLSMKFFRAFIKRYLKGGEKVETASPSYTKPARTGSEPWANY